MIDAKEYGRALFLLSEERGTADTVADEMKTVVAVLRDNPRYVRLLDTPAVGQDEKLGLIDTAFAGLDTDLRNFIKILAGKHAVFDFEKCEETFAALYDEARGIERVVAVTAVALTDAQKTRLSEKLASKTGKKIVLTNTVDPSLLGGIRLRYMGKQIDASLATRLASLEAAIRGTIVN